MKERNSLFIITVLKKIIEVYFDTFFVLYFFQVANYEVLPLAKYYILVYLFTGIGFFIIRKAMKNNQKIPYFRIGIALQAIYVSAIMLLKEDLINHIISVGIIKGMADGFYYFPKNILDSEKVSNTDRQKYNGIISTIQKIIGIVVPIGLGVILTFVDYITVGKFFFLLHILMFLFSFGIKEEYKLSGKIELKKYFALVKTNKEVKYATLIPFLSGLTYSSGVMGTIITLLKINNFKTNLNLGFVDSICAGISLIICVLYALKIKKKQFNVLLIFCGIGSFAALFLIGMFPAMWSLIIYLLVRFSFIQLLNMITDHTVANFSNIKELKTSLKEEFYLVRDMSFSVSRVSGYVILLVICLVWGMDYISYILILPAISLFIETILIRKLLDKIE